MYITRQRSHNAIIKLIVSIAMSVLFLIQCYPAAAVAALSMLSSSCGEGTSCIDG